MKLHELLTKEEAKKLRSFSLYPNGDWMYKDEARFHHLFRDEKELTEGVKAKRCYSYKNGDWMYVDEEEFVHLFRDCRELTEGVKAMCCWSYDGGDWEYEDEAGKCYRFNKDGESIC